MNIIKMATNHNGALEGCTLAKYKVIQEIGRGASGTVYLGHDPFIERPVAIKVAHEERLANTENGDIFRKLFFNEAQAAGMLKHPGITSIFDAGADNDVCYIVMEYVHGDKTVDNYCSIDNLLPVEDAISLIYKLALALDYAHKKGVIHRNLKPKNILLTHEMEVKISDFGLSVIPDQMDTDILDQTGSPFYVSPEQVQQEAITGQSDLFSLGVIMYELLTGKHPFSGANVAAINHKILNTEPTPLKEFRSDIPEVLQRIVERSLSKNKDERYQSGMDLAGDLSLVFDFLSSSEETTSRQEKFKALEGVTLFRDFTEPEKWEMINACVWQKISAGDKIIVEGEMDSSFYVIISGSVSVTKGGTYVDNLHAGDCFGEMSFISGKQRSATIRANEDIVLMKLQSPMIERASLNCQLRYHKLFLHTLIERLARATDRIACFDEQKPGYEE